MLSSIRKFSSSIYSKIFLIIVAVPFIFWGMGPVFQSGKQNTIAEIGKEKISTQEFVDFIEANAIYGEELNDNKIEEFFSTFIGEKLITMESQNLDIKLSDLSLSKIIKNEKLFQKNNEFSRTEYEKFLVKNSLSARSLEINISEQAKKDQLFNFIAGGIVPSEFLVNFSFNKINQKRNIEIIDLNKFIEKKSNFSNDEIESYYNKNKNKFNEVYKSIKFIELNPKNLTGNEEFSDLFFKKIDEIDDMIFEGQNIDLLLEKFNLGQASSVSFDSQGVDKDLKKINIFPHNLIKNVFNISKSEPAILIESENKKTS